MPRGLSPASVQYVRLVDRTQDDLAFLLDNVAPQITLERSVACLERLELLLNELQRRPDPDSVFPDVVETLGPLCARFGAIILLESPHVGWIE